MAGDFIEIDVVVNDHDSEKALTGIARAEESVGTAATRATPPINAMHNAITAGTATTRAATQHLGQMASSMQLLDRGASMLGVSLSVGAAIGFGKKIADDASQIQSAAEKLDVSTDAIQRWSYAFSKSDVSLDSVNQSLSFLNKNLGDPSTGTKAAVTALGLSMEDLTSSSLENAFETIATAAQKIPDPMRQAAIMTDLFGRSGQDLLPGVRANMVAIGREAPIMAKEVVGAWDEVGEVWDRRIKQLESWVARPLAFAMKTPVQIITDQYKTTYGPATLPATPSAPRLVPGLAPPTIDAETTLANLEKERTATERYSQLITGIRHDTERAVIEGASTGLNQRLQLLDLERGYEKRAAEVAVDTVERRRAAMHAIDTKYNQLQSNEQEKFLRGLVTADTNAQLTQLQSIGTLRAGNATEDRATALETARIKIQLSETGLSADLKIFDLERAAREKDYADQHAGELFLQQRLTQLHELGSQQRLKIENDYADGVNSEVDRIIQHNIQAAEQRKKDLRDWAAGFLSVDASLQRLESSLQRLSQTSHGTFGSITNDLAQVVGSLAEVRASYSDLQKVMEAREAQSHDGKSGGGGFFGNLISGATTFLEFAGPIGGMISGIVSGFQAIGHLINRDPGRDIVEKYANSLGGFDAVHRQLQQLGDDGERLWVNLTQKVGKADTSAARAAIDAVRDALDHAGDSAADLAMKVADAHRALADIISEANFDADQAGRSGVEAVLADLEHRRQKEIDALAQYGALDAALYAQAVEAVSRKYTALADRAIKDEADRLTSQTQSQVDELSKISGVLDGIKRHTDEEIAGLGQFSSAGDFYNAVIAKIHGRQSAAELSQLARAGKVVAPGTTPLTTLTTAGITVNVTLGADESEKEFADRVGNSLLQRMKHYGLRI